MLLAHRDRLRTALQQVSDIAHVSLARPGKNAALLAIEAISKACECEQESEHGSLLVGNEVGRQRSERNPNPQTDADDEC